MRKKGSLESWELRRNIAVDMREQGHRPAAIAAALTVSVRTVYQWLARYRAAGGRDGGGGGRAALRSRKPPGRTPRLTDEQRATLRQLLLKTPQENGFAGRYLWTQQLIADLIRRQFNVAYHHDRIGRILKRMGFTHQQACPPGQGA